MGQAAPMHYNFTQKKKKDGHSESSGQTQTLMVSDTSDGLRATVMDRACSWVLEMRNAMQIQQMSLEADGMRQVGTGMRQTPEMTWI